MLRILTVLFFLFGAVQTQASELEAQVNGFIWFEYGKGSSRYLEGNGSDRATISHAALAVNGMQDNMKFHLLAGAEGLASTVAKQAPATADVGDLDLIEAYMTFNDIFGVENLSFSAGLMPLGFGLKPSSWGGRRNIHNPINEGGANGFDVHSRIEKGVAFGYNLMDMATITLNFYDSPLRRLNVPTGGSAIIQPSSDGSTLTKNYALGIRSNNLGVDGLYAYIGYESQYFSTDDASIPIYDIGLGFNHEMFDISYEYVKIHRNIAANHKAGRSGAGHSQALVDFGTNTNSFEFYHILDITYKLMEGTEIYIDQAKADKTKTSSFRLGVNHVLNETFSVKVEYSMDQQEGTTFRGPAGTGIPTDIITNVKSLDVRFAATF